MSKKNKDILSVAGMLGGLALLSMSSKTTKVYASDNPVPSYVPPPPSPPSPPPPPPPPPKSTVTLSVDKTIIREDETALATINIDSYPYNTSQGLDINLIDYNEKYLIGNCGYHIPPGYVKFPMTAGCTIRELVFQDPLWPQNYQYFVCIPIGTSTIIAQISSYGQPAVYSNTVNITRTANGYLYDAHLLEAYRNENGNIVVTIDVNADPNTYMLVLIYYIYPYDIIHPQELSPAMAYRIIGGGTYTIVGPVPFEQYEKVQAVNVAINHPGDKVITTETLKV
jgi:hypothetical protein